MPEYNMVENAGEALSTPSMEKVKKVIATCHAQAMRIRSAVVTGDSLCTEQVSTISATAAATVINTHSTVEDIQTQTAGCHKWDMTRNAAILQSMLRLLLNSNTWT